MSSSGINQALKSDYERIGIWELLNSPDVVEIMINDPKSIFYEDNEGIHKIERPESEYIKENEIQQLGISINNHLRLNKRLDSNSPFLSLTLPQGERAHFVVPPAVAFSSLTIRIPSKANFEMQQYEQTGFFEDIELASNGISNNDNNLLMHLGSKNYRLFFEQAVKFGKNIVVSGATGSGKTTFMKTLVSLINPSRRIITIEDSRELFIPHQNQVNLLYSKNEDDRITAKASLESCLRMRPDNIILGELRGDEAFYFIRACGNGHSGSISSLHADNPLMAIEQIALMIKASKDAGDLEYDTIKSLILMNIDISIHISKTPSGRKITGIYFDPERRLKLLQGEK